MENYKFTILINQRVVVENNLDLDLVDMALFDFISTFIGNSNCQSIQDSDGKIYYWVSYQKVISDMPLLPLKTKVAVYTRFKKLVDQNILIPYYDNKRIGRTYFRTGPVFDMLLYNQK